MQFASLVTQHCSKTLGQKDKAQSEFHSLSVEAPPQFPGVWDQCSAHTWNRFWGCKRIYFWGPVLYCFSKVITNPITQINLKTWGAFLTDAESWRFCCQPLPNVLTVNQKWIALKNSWCPQIQTYIQNIFSVFPTYNTYNLPRLNHLFIECWLQKYCSCKAPEHAVPLQRGQGGTSPNWSSQILGDPPLPSLGGEFLTFQIFENLQITINSSQLVFPKMETAKSGLFQKCDPFWAVCKAGSEISPGGREGRDVSRPEGAGNTEDFPSCQDCVGKATAAVLLGSGGNARLGIWQGLLDTETLPCLIILQAGLGSLDLQLSLFFLQRLASPRCWFLWQ